MSKETGLLLGEDGKTRCWWHGNQEGYLEYHDNEWGHPVTNDTRLFEKICLEGFQSGLSWLTILRKRENFRKAFANFDINKVAKFDDNDIERLVLDAGIVRHRGKMYRPSTMPIGHWNCRMSLALSPLISGALNRAKINVQKR